MRIGVTGASGLVGFNFCELAQSKKNHLNILIRKDIDYLKKIKAKKFYGTLDDIETLEKFCSCIYPKLVIYIFGAFSQTRRI